ncbi:hypothetical protein R6Q59_017350 [Mikania micrantha]
MGITDIEEDTRTLWWTEIGDGSFLGSKARVTHIRYHLIKYVHRLIDTSILDMAKALSGAQIQNLFNQYCLLSQRMCHLFSISRTTITSNFVELFTVVHTSQ